MKQKNYQNLTKNTLGKLPVWNLKDLYESPNAKNLNNDLNQLRRITKKFENKYTFKITKLSPSQLLKAIIELENIDIKIDKIIEDTKDISKVEQKAKLEGRQMTLIIQPN